MEEESASFFQHFQKWSEKGNYKMANFASDTKIFSKAYCECFQEAVMKLSSWTITEDSVLVNKNVAMRKTSHLATWLYIHMKDFRSIFMCSSMKILSQRSETVKRASNNRNS